MPEFARGADGLRSLEEYAGGDSFVHRLQPGTKTVAAFAYIAIVVSFGRHDFLRLAPFAFYPAILMSVAGIPARAIAPRLLSTLPFCAFAGLSDVFLERAPAAVLGPVAISLGAVSLATITLKAILCVSAVLILAATTRFSLIARELRAIRVPAALVTTLEMTYRYVGTIAEEARSMRTAYALRSGRDAVDLRDFGAFAGTLFLKSMDRAERVYGAMRCRGYDGGARPTGSRPAFSMGDAAFLASVLSAGLAARLGDPAGHVAALIARLLPC